MSSQQKKTAALLALSDSSSLTEAASRAGISTRTLYNYIHDDLSFSKAYNGIQEQAIISVTDKLSECVGSAVNAIKEIVESEATPPTVRLKAAIAILNIYDNHSSDLTSMSKRYVNENSCIFKDLF